MATVAELQAQIEALEQKNQELVERIAANKSAPEFSSVFVNAKTREPMAWKNLSETKRKMEKAGLLAPIQTKADSETLTSDQFHSALMEIIADTL